MQLHTFMLGIDVALRALLLIFTPPFRYFRRGEACAKAKNLYPVCYATTPIPSTFPVTPPRALAFCSLLLFSTRESFSRRLSRGYLLLQRANPQRESDRLHRLLHHG